MFLFMYGSVTSTTTSNTRRSTASLLRRVFQRWRFWTLREKTIYSQQTGEFEDMRHMDAGSVTAFLEKWKRT